VREFGDRVELRMYHTPNLAKLRKSLIPRRFDEGWGLQHMKLYGFDDELILSGANLSNDYFSNRQDRYHLFSSASITSFYKAVHETVCSVSFAVNPANNASGFTLDWTSEVCPNPIEFPKRYKSYTSKLIQSIVRPIPLDHCEFTEKDPLPTVVYPLVQMTPLLQRDTLANTEQPTVNAVLDLLAALPGAAWHFTAGYFNVFEEYRSRLFNAIGRGTIITASPDANGFYGSRGPSGMLPAGYTLLARRFLRELERQKSTEKDASIGLKEWTRGLYGSKDRWTYHAKGLWIQPLTTESSEGPSLTFVGSSNFTRRSQKLDLEATALIITADSALQRALKQEVKHLESYAATVDKTTLDAPERKADLKTRISLWLCQGML
jgi:CDP-diacylglycerol--glycerol-3-phosphate 3-phosphatidyltransferase